MPGRSKLARAALAVMLVTATAQVLMLRANSSSGSVITPPSSYSDPAWGTKAGRYQGNLARVQSGISSKYGPGKLGFVTTGESLTGGIGFWTNPMQFGNPARYLSVFIRVQVPPRSTGRAFQDNQGGRVLTIMDAYGKYIISVLAKELQAMNDPRISGGAIIFIFSKKSASDPSFEQSAEMIGIFMPSQSLITFSQLRMTIHTLFSQSAMLPIFQGQDQINNFKTLVLRP